MPRLIYSVGELPTTFDMNGLDVSFSCGVSFKNRQLIFGGMDAMRQILQIEDCGLEAVGSLPFDHVGRACGSSQGVIVLCFNAMSPNDSKLCRQASSPDGPWADMAQSTYDHGMTSIAISPGD